MNRDLACLLFVTFIVYSFGNESVFDNLHQSCAVLAIKSLWETQDVQFIPHLIRFHFLPMLNSSLTSSAFTFFRCSIHPHLISFYFLPMFNSSLTSSAFTFYRCSVHPSPHQLSLSTFSPAFNTDLSGTVTFSTSGQFIPGFSTLHRPCSAGRKPYDLVFDYY